LTLRSLRELAPLRDFLRQFTFGRERLFFTINLTDSSKLETLYALDSRRS
jgi:hypothetical protein